MISHEPFVFGPLIVEAMLVLVPIGLKCGFLLVSGSLCVGHGKLIRFPITRSLVFDGLSFLLLVLKDLGLDVAKDCFFFVLLLGGFSTFLGELPCLASFIVLPLDIVVFQGSFDLRLNNHLLILLSFPCVVVVEFLELGSISCLSLLLFSDAIILHLLLTNDVHLFLLFHLNSGILPSLDVQSQLI